MGTKRINYRKRMTATDYVIGAILIVGGLIVLYPFYNSIMVSLVPQDVYLKTPFMLFPGKITFDSYRAVLMNKALLDSFFVTTVITVFGILYNMFLTVMTAYALTKKFPGKQIVMILIIITMYFSGGLIPYYLLMRSLGLMNKLAVMVLPMGFNVYYLIIVRSFFAEIPQSLEESAKIDGANDLTILFRIILPLSLPVLATFSLYYGVERWNEWWHGMLFIKSAVKQPLQLLLRSIVQEFSNDQIAEMAASSDNMVIFSEGVKMASIVITMFPIMCIYPFLQRYFIKGLTIGAVKG